MRDNAAMRDARPPTFTPARSTATRAPERVARSALQRGRQRRRARAVVTIAIVAIAHLAVALWAIAGFVGASHGIEAAAKAHAVVALLQTTRIARDGKSANTPAGNAENADATRKAGLRSDFLPLLIASPPPASPPAAPAQQKSTVAASPSQTNRRAPLAAATTRSDRNNARHDGNTGVAEPASQRSAALASASRALGTTPPRRSADDIEATAARLAMAAGVTAASAGQETAATRDAATHPAQADNAVGNDANMATAGDSANSDEHGTADTAPGTLANAANPASAGSAGAPATTDAPAVRNTASSTTATPGNGAGVSGTATPGPAQQGTRFALLPSSDLVYDTFYNGAQNQSGTLHWRTDGQHYSLLVSMPVPFIGTFSYRSEGHIDDYGLAPDTYTETRGRRGESVSRFDRDGATPHVSFTRSPTDVPLAPGAQDRFSMIFQLASLVRADPSRYQPGVTRVFDVIDSNSAETWPIQTIGPDRTMLGTNQVETLHFMRLPRKPGDKRRIDVWLAPSMNWIPVRIMQTEPNGTQIELVFHARLPPA
jgi:hypothetical protein